MVLITNLSSTSSSPRSSTTTTTRNYVEPAQRKTSTILHTISISRDKAKVSATRDTETTILSNISSMMCPIITYTIVMEQPGELIIDITMILFSMAFLNIP